MGLLQMEEMIKQFNTMKEAFYKEKILEYTERKKKLNALIKEIKRSKSDFANAVNDDFGTRSKFETTILELVPTIRSIKYLRFNLKEWMKIEYPKTSAWFYPGKCQILPQPLGVVGIISPWNYPIYLSLIPLATAIAAGNRIMLKLSSKTPKTNLIIESIIKKVFNPNEVIIANNDLQKAESFLDLPFDHLFFTGSSETGKIVMQHASKTLSSVTLELGGKSPVIISDNYPIEVAVNRIMTGKLFNSGQTCIAPDYVFVPENKLELFVRYANNYVLGRFRKIVDNPDYTSIIDSKQYDRLISLESDAKEKGAVTVALGEETNNLEKRKIIPTLFLKATPSMRIMQEEIFGPFLPVISYKNINGVIDFINNNPKPLAMYLFDNNPEAQIHILEKTYCGGITVNDTLLHAAQDELPFGGIGESGIGRYHGKAGFDTFTHYKSVFVQSNFNGFALMRQPFGLIAKLISKLMMIF
jgi:acyl-CoA reductase-like NAD-dependent aldehyde dehydrogenase